MIAWAALAIACEPGAAEAVHRLPGDLDGQSGEERGHPGHVPVVLARLVRAAEDDVLDRRRVDARAVDDGPDGKRRKVVGSDIPERAAVPADGGADGADDPGVANRAVGCRGHGSGLPAGGGSLRILRTRRPSPNDGTRAGPGSRRPDG